MFSLPKKAMNKDLSWCSSVPVTRATQKCRSQCKPDLELEKASVFLPLIPSSALKQIGPRSSLFLLSSLCSIVDLKHSLVAIFITLPELIFLKQQVKNYQGNKCLAWGNFASLLEKENPRHLNI